MNGPSRSVKNVLRGRQQSRVSLGISTRFEDHQASILLRRGGTGGSPSALRSPPDHAACEGVNVMFLLSAREEQKKTRHQGGGSLVVAKCEERSAAPPPGPSKDRRTLHPLSQELGALSGGGRAMIPHLPMRPMPLARVCVHSVFDKPRRHPPIPEGNSYT